MYDFTGCSAQSLSLPILTGQIQALSLPVLTGQIQSLSASHRP